jgi:hypothetical protein
MNNEQMSAEQQEEAKQIKAEEDAVRKEEEELRKEEEKVRKIEHELSRIFSMKNAKAHRKDVFGPNKDA